MRTAGAIFTLCILTGAASAKTADRRHPSWLVGEWGVLHRDGTSDCGSQFSMTYLPDGKYEFMDESGRWQVKGTTIIEKTTHDGGTSDFKLNEPRSARIIERSAKRVSLYWLGRGRETWARCAAR